MELNLIGLARSLILCRKIFPNHYTFCTTCLRESSEDPDEQTTGVAAIADGVPPQNLNEGTFNGGQPDAAQPLPTAGPWAGDA